MIDHEDGEEMCVTSGMAIASLVNISFFTVTRARLHRPETALFGHFMPSPNQSGYSPGGRASKFFLPGRR